MASALLLLRHGQIAANREGRWHGSTDSALTWRGRRQASRTARHIATAHNDIQAIYTSPLQRCQHTAQASGKALSLQVRIEDPLREYAIGEYEGMRFRDLAEQHNFVNRATADLHYAPPGGESLATVAERISHALLEIHKRHTGKVLIVSHGAVLAVGVAKLMHDNPAQWVDYHFANCSLTELIIEPQPYLNTFNETNHL